MSQGQSDSRIAAISNTSSARRLFMGKTLAAGAGLVGAGAIVRSAAASQPNPPVDGTYFKQARRNFRDLRRHENDHVDFLVGALGGDARPKPNFVNLEQPN